MEDLSVRVVKFMIASAITVIVYALGAALRWPDLVSGVLGVVAFSVVFDPPMRVGDMGVEEQAGAGDN